MQTFYALVLDFTISIAALYLVLALRANARGVV